VASILSRTLHLASVFICLIVIASFTVWAVDQTSNASAHQQEVLNDEVKPTTAAVNGPAGASAKSSAPHESAVHEAIDEASKAFTAPFDGITAGWSSEWLIRSANLGLALLVYGFGLGYLARLIRVRL
jgi:hypothetical protein